MCNVDWFFKSHRLPLAIEGIERGYSVFLISNNTGYFQEFELLGIKCMDVKFSRGFANPILELLNVFKLVYYYYILKPHIIHLITLKISIYGNFAAFFYLKKVRIINAITGLGFLFTLKSGINPFLVYFLKLTFIRKSSNKFIFQNDDDKLIFSKIAKLEDKNCIIIKGAGVNEDEFIRTSLTLSNDKIRITLVSRMLKDKGVLEFIDSAKLLRPLLYNKCEFLLVGGIDLNNPSRIFENELIARLEENYIIWLGHRNDIFEIYNLTDIACLPSYREGIPKSLIEAMSMSCPIITTYAPGCKECVIEGVNGYLVPIKDVGALSDKIYELVSNSKLRKSMGIQSRKIMVKEMSLKKIIQLTFDFYVD